MSEKRDRRFPVDPWGLVTWLLVLAALVLVLTGIAMDDGQQSADQAERAARFEAQERYYEALDLYGDVEGATEAARVVYGKVVGE